MKIKRIVSLFYFNKNIAGKDMFLVPKYLSDFLGGQGEIVYPKWDENNEFNNEYRGVKLVPIKSNSEFNSTIWSEKEITWWLIKNAKNIDVLCLFWLNTRNVIFANLYKLINPKGICYIKGDLGFVDYSKLSTVSVKSILKSFFFKAVDIFSVETEINYEAIQNGLFGNHLRKATVLMPNGFDINLFDKFNIVKKKFIEKENLIITVGRIGHQEKNNEMMLAALNGVDMKEWRFILVGNIEERFIKTYHDFIIDNPDKKEKVILSGAINDKHELWELYNKAKVFLLTSPKEGFPIVYSEALAFGNYIITTNVSGAKEISDNNKIGKLIDIGDVDALRNVLCDVFENKIDLEDNYNKAINFSETKFNWIKLVKVIGDKVIKIKDEANHK